MAKGDGEMRESRHERSRAIVTRWHSSRHRVGLFVSVAAIALLTGCRSVAGGKIVGGSPNAAPPVDMLVRVLEDTVTLVPDGDAFFFVATADVRVTNRSTRPLYLQNCGDPTQPLLIVEQLTDGVWKASYQGVCSSVLAFPTTIAPHDSATFHHRLWHTTRPNTVPRFFADDPTGVARIRVAAAAHTFDPATMTGSEPVVAESRLSNVFLHRAAALGTPAPVAGSDGICRARSPVRLVPYTMIAMLPAPCPAPTRAIASAAFGSA